VCLSFLRDGTFQVRGTVRDSQNAKKVEPLRKAFGELFNNLELVNADLLQPESLDAAIAGCDYVVHTASPFPYGNPKDESVVVRPAVEGTIAVMKAAHKHKVKRVVITSSIAAVMFRRPENEKESYDENDWSDADFCKPYEKSKTLAEKAAWNYVH
jgi:nucleoside-diphosphate-sugar epimerase